MFYCAHTMAEGDEKMIETRFRYIHHKVGKDVGIQQNQVHNQVHKLELNSVHTDTVVMEKLEDSVVMLLRILNINYRRVTPVFFSEYSSVQRLEIGCSLSIYWLFRQLPFLPKLSVIRFGRQMFNDKDEDEQSQTFRQHMAVTTLEINYDHDLYTQFLNNEKSLVESKITIVLNLSKEYFPNLQYCNIQVPKSIESHLDDFSKRFPHIYHGGEKRTRYVDGPVTFVSQPLNHRRKQQARGSQSSGRSSSGSRESFNSPLYDRPDVVQPQATQQTSSFGYMKVPKVEPEAEDPEIVILESSQNHDRTNSNHSSTVEYLAAPANNTTRNETGGKRRNKSPSMLSRSAI
ncbi:unnamed protein product [Allacma fusca]|uniref:Uncharacterized protein n=1 Tax=Allacma fusca TaxID=39272 RepID=A0A8J2M6E4_9HEXA|nr:unnamed protein product [Allacma fusca]